MRTLRPSRLGEKLGRLYAQTRREVGATRAPALESRAARVVREYLYVHRANLERAARLGEKAERMEKDGTPSESARNRAERAWGEVAAGITALRASFVEAAGEREGARAFDRVVELLCPGFAPRLPSAGRYR